MRFFCLGATDAKVARVDHQVFLDREIRIDVVLLRHHADTHPRGACIARHRMAEQGDRAGIGRHQAQAHAQVVGLAGAVRAEQAEAGAARNENDKPSTTTASP